MRKTSYAVALAAVAATLGVVAIQGVALADPVQDVCTTAGQHGHGQDQGGGGQGGLGINLLSGLGACGTGSGAGG